MRLSLLRLALAGAIAGGFLAAAPISAAASAAEVPPGFTSNMANVNGVRLHFVSGGAGPALILIHGFPQDWSEYRAIMPRLSKRFTVMALDLRGIGQSSIASGGYDADALAKDVYELAKAQKLDDVYVVGHDLGGQVAYAFARQYPSATQAAMLRTRRFPASTAGTMSTTIPVCGTSISCRFQACLKNSWPDARMLGSTTSCSSVNSARRTKRMPTQLTTRAAT